jgi:hypothetical protein
LPGPTPPTKFRCKLGQYVPELHILRNNNKSEKSRRLHKKTRKIELRVSTSKKKKERIERKKLLGRSKRRTAKVFEWRKKRSQRV